jgi:hypothetical protein
MVGRREMISLRTASGRLLMWSALPPSSSSPDDTDLLFFKVGPPASISMERIGG